MDVTDHTSPDWFCHRLGLSGFADAEFAAIADAARLILRPSFRAGVCLTLERTSVEIRTNPEWIGYRPDPPQGLNRIETIALSPTLGAAWLMSLDRLLKLPPVAQHRVFLDGMGYEIAIASGGDIFRLKGHASENSPFTAVLPGLVTMLYDVVTDPHIKNVIAGIGEYRGLNLAYVEIEEPVPRTRVALIGDPDNQRELLDRLQHGGDVSGNSVQ